MAQGHDPGLINSPISLDLIFIIALQPIAYVIRLTGYDRLRRRRKAENTYKENLQDYTGYTRIF